MRFCLVVVRTNVSQHTLSIPETVIHHHYYRRLCARYTRVTERPQSCQPVSRLVGKPASQQSRERAVISSSCHGLGDRSGLNEFLCAHNYHYL